VYVGAIDESLTSDGLITPGIGDAGEYFKYELNKIMLPEQPSPLLSQQS
jgi:hypothetical protein